MKENISPKRKSYSTTANPNLASPGNPFNSFTSTKTFGNVFRLIPEGDDNYIRNAFYNVLAFICLSVVLGISVAVYFVLEKFLRPIAWALLFGAFLFPFKYRLSRCLYQWIDSISVPETRKDSNNRTFIFSLFYSPLFYSAQLIQKVGDNIIAQWKYIFSLLGIITGIYFINKLKIFTISFTIIKYLATVFVNSFDFWLTLFTRPWILVLLLCFFISIFFTEYPPHILKISSYVIWFLIMCNLANYLTNNYKTQSLIFLFLVTIYISGILYDMKINRNKIIETEFEDSDISDTEKSKINTFDEDMDPKIGLKEIKELVVRESISIQREAKLKEQVKHPDSTAASGASAWNSKRYIMMLVWACLFIEFYKWVLLLVPLAIAISIVKRIGSHFGIWEITYDTICNLIDNCPSFHICLSQFKLVLINTPIKGVYQLFLTLDRLLITSIRNSIDHATTVLLLFFTLMGLLILGIFLSFQIYQESAHIVNIAHSAVNTTISENQWFQSSGQMEKSMDTVIEKGYQTGREWIASQFNDFNKPNNKDLSKLESQVLNLWDNIYDNMKKKGGPWRKPHGESEDNSNLNVALNIHKRNILLRNWQNVLESVTQLGSAHREGIVKFVKENIDTFNSVLSTVWVIVKSNFNIIIIVLSNVWGIIFGGGTAILNFFLSWVIFLSTIIYFLSSSGDQYKPFEWLTQFVPSNDDEHNGTDIRIHKSDTGLGVKLSAIPRININKPMGTTQRQQMIPYKDEGAFQQHPNTNDQTTFDSSNLYGGSNTGGGANKIAKAIQEAISGVFAATLKMATFYGLYTWLTHKVFGVGMVYIPTALAAIFAAVPFVGTYVAALPATLELWIITGSYVIPLIFLGLHFLPKFFVDTTIYQEIKGGGHPYFTGLSIVGGMYMFGLEGALIGPILLCCLLAGLKVFGAYMHEE